MICILRACLGDKNYAMYFDSEEDAVKQAESMFDVEGGYWEIWDTETGNMIRCKKD